MSDISDTAQLTAMLRSHVERALMEIWERPDLVVDDDGDYPFRTQTSVCWVRVVESDDPTVRVFSHAAVGVKKTARMLTELNDLNQQARWAKLAWCHGVIVVDVVLHWTNVDQASLSRALDAVSGVSDDVGSLFAGVFGGSTPFPLDLSEDSPAA